MARLTSDLSVWRIDGGEASNVRKKDLPASHLRLQILASGRYAGSSEGENGGILFIWMLFCPKRRQ